MTDVRLSRTSSLLPPKPQSHAAPVRARAWHGCDPIGPAAHDSHCRPPCQSAGSNRGTALGPSAPFARFPSSGEEEGEEENGGLDSVEIRWNRCATCGRAIGALGRWVNGEGTPCGIRRPRYLPCVSLAVRCPRCPVRRAARSVVGPGDRSRSGSDAVRWNTTTAPEVTRREANIRGAGLRGRPPRSGRERRCGKAVSSRRRFNQIAGEKHVADPHAECR